jgi:UDP-N-acetylmuramate dehydrogenase
LKNFLIGAIILDIIKRAFEESVKGGILTKTHVESRLFSFYAGGGTLDLAVFPNSLAQLINVANIIKKNSVEFLIIGACSNTLIRDSGYSGISLMTKFLNDICISENFLTALSGTRLQTVISEARRNGLSGIEDLAGIPASIGGAVVMNSGACGTEICQLVEKISFLDLSDLQIKEVLSSDVPFEYRSSNAFFNDKIITSVMFKLKSENQAKISDRINSALARRRNTQPSEPSLGCVFKKINGFSAGCYVEAAGLKGTRIGGAEISVKHANFIINTGNGTASDYIALVEIAENLVQSKFNITLNREILIKGD